MSTHGSAGAGGSTVALWAHQLTPNVLGGLRSTLMLARHVRRTPTVIMTNQRSGFADLASRFAVPTLLVPSDVTLRGFRRMNWRLKLRLGLSILALQYRLTRLLDRVRARILQVDHEAWWLVAPLPRLLGYRVVQYMRCQPSRVSWRHWLTLVLSNRDVFISDALRDWVLRQVPPPVRRVIASKAVTVRNSIDLDAIREYQGSNPVPATRARIGLDNPKAVWMLAVGTLCERKGQLAFLSEVAPALLNAAPHVHLVFVGDADPPEWRARCQRIVDWHGLSDRVRFVPFTEAIFDWYQACDVLVHYAVAEGIPRVVLEAQAFGRPVVARQILGIEEAVVDRLGGFLVSGPRAFVRRALELAEDEPLRRRMGAAGSRLVARRFAPECAAAQMESVYASVLTSRRPT